MADIRFYHMEHATLDTALPAITTKAWQSGKNVMICTPSKTECKRLNDLLWTFYPSAFIPHGGDGDKHADKNPVWVTAGNDNVNNAKILILTYGCTHDSVGDFDMVCEMLDGRVESQIASARARWKTYKDAGHDLTYWQQDDNGRWNKK